MQDRFRADNKFVAVSSTKREVRGAYGRPFALLNFLVSNRLNGSLSCGNIQYMFILTFFMHFAETKKDT